MKEIRAEQIVEAVAGLCVRANCNLSEDVARRIRRRAEEEDFPQGKAILEQIIRNFEYAGERELPAKGRITVAQMVRGLNGLKEMGEALGRHNPLYRHAVEGINEKMNTNIEDAFRDEYTFECFVAEAIIHNLIAGHTIDREDVQTGFRHQEFREIVLDYCRRFGM